MSTWVEVAGRASSGKTSSGKTSSGKQQYRVCARELQNFDGLHEGIRIVNIAFEIIL